MKILEDGYYKINSKRGAGGGTSIILINGTFTLAELGYYDDYNNWVPLTDGAMVAGKQYRLDHGHDSPIYVHITDPSSCSLLVNGKA